MSAISRAHTVADFYPCRDATEEMQICQHCGEDRRDHLGWEELGEEPGPTASIVREFIETFTFSPDPVPDHKAWRDIP